MIHGLVVTNLTVRCDDRGSLTELLRANDPHFTKFGQVYIVNSVGRGTIRAFHKHTLLWDWFHICLGSAKFVFVDDRPLSPTYNEIQTVVMGRTNQSLITVPPGVLHGWMALTDDVIMISIASDVYNRTTPDEVRVDPYKFGDVWSVKGK